MLYIVIPVSDSQIEGLNWVQMCKYHLLKFTSLSFHWSGPQWQKAVGLVVTHVEVVL